MSSQTLIALIVIHCLAHTGYRRAGLCLCKGDNEFKAADISDAQLAQLKADPRLRVSSKERELPAYTSDESPSQASSSKPLATETELSKASLPSQEEVPLGNVVLGMSMAENIAKLDPSNPAHFTNSGKPQCDALSELTGTTISAAERDALWAEYVATESKAQDAD